MTTNNTKLEQLAQEISQLAKTHKAGSANGTFALATDSPLIDKAKELIAEASSPDQHALSLLQSLVEVSTIRILSSLNVLQSIPLQGSISLATLSTKTNITPTFLQRLLRVVISTNFLHLTPGDEYAHTRLSAGYLDLVLGFVNHCIDMTILPLMNMPAYLAAHDNQEPRSFTHNPMTFLAGQEGKTPFEILSQRPDMFKGMHAMMVVATSMRPYTGFYDYAKLVGGEAEPERVVFVDVGGGNGHVVQGVLDGCPEILAEKCVLQDRADVIELAKKEGKLDAKVKTMGHDFFQEQPVEGARAYHFRAVMHDLSDEDAVRVLEKTAKVMREDSRVLIAECVIDERYNKGVTALFDPMMMQIGGRERTEKDFREVLGKAGLRLDGVFPSGVANWTILEAVLQ